VIEMGSNNTRKGACGKVRRGLDAHLGGELDAAAAGETRAHLKECAPCAALLEERLRVRDLLRRAVRGVQAPPALAGSIRAMIRQG
jgi:anti-sigma factor (TIGR02949 family)